MQTFDINNDKEANPEDEFCKVYHIPGEDSRKSSAVELVNGKWSVRRLHKQGEGEEGLVFTEKIHKRKPLDFTEVENVSFDAFCKSGLNDHGEIMVRAKCCMDGAETLKEAASMLKDHAKYLEHLISEGYELTRRVHDDHGFAAIKIKFTVEDG